MACPKPSPLEILLRNTLIVFFVFFVIDIAYYYLISPGKGAGIPAIDFILKHALFTLILSIAYAHLYNKTSRIWRPGSNEGFIHTPDKAGKECDATFEKIVNGVIFSLLTSTVIITAMALGALIVTTVYLYVLHGIRGEPPTGESVVFVSKTILAGMVLELKGKTEDDPR